MLARCRRSTDPLMSSSTTTFEDDDALPLPGRRERTQKRRPGVITFDEDAAADR